MSEFTVDDFDTLTPIVSNAWRAGRDADWSAKAGTVNWPCTKTANHTLDSVLAVAFFLASRKQDAYPDWDWSVPNAKGADDLADAMDAVGRVLSAVIRAAEPGTTAIIWRRPQPTVKPAPDFAARGALEMVLHGHDVCLGLGVPFEPPAAECARLRDHTREWVHWTAPGWHTPDATDDAWGDLLDASGRGRVPHE